MGNPENGSGGIGILNQDGFTPKRIFNMWDFRCYIFCVLTQDGWLVTKDSINRFEESLSLITQSTN